MRAVLQRVRTARVLVEDRVTGEIGAGLVVLLGIGQGDTTTEADLLADKIIHLRIFGDENSKFNLSSLDTAAEMLVISQFTLFADCRKGRRPSFSDAARPEAAEPLIEHFTSRLRAAGLKVASGEFQADMLVQLENSGPVTICLDTNDLPRRT